MGGGFLTMAEYIEREALFAKFDRMGLGEHSLVEKIFSDGVRTIIAAMPAADVVPVVRCRGCANRGTGDCPMEQAYCSYIGKPSGGSWEEDV